MPEVGRRELGEDGQRRVRRVVGLGEERRRRRFHRPSHAWWWGSATIRGYSAATSATEAPASPSRRCGGWVTQACSGRQVAVEVEGLDGQPHQGPPR